MTGPAGPTGPSASVGAFTILSVGTLDVAPVFSTLPFPPTPANQQYISLPNTSIIYITNTSTNYSARQITNMSGGVNGRQVTFVLQPNTVNMTGVYFINYPNGSFNGTGIYISTAPPLSGSILLQYGEAVTFVYMSIFDGGKWVYMGKSAPQ